MWVVNINNIITAEANKLQKILLENIDGIRIAWTII